MSPRIDKLVEDIRILISNSKNRIQSQVNSALVNTYWQIGQLISRKEKAENLSSRELIIDLSKILTSQLGRGFSRSNLFNMRNFYLAYPNVQTLSGQLSWSHICELISIEDLDKRAFYENEIVNSKYTYYIPDKEQLVFQVKKAMSKFNDQ